MISYNRNSRTVHGPAGNVVLSPEQAAMLVALPAYPKAIPTADLIRKVWDRDPTIKKHVVHCRAVVWQLRGRLSDAGFDWGAVHAQYRTGYSLRG